MGRPSVSARPAAAVPALAPARPQSLVLPASAGSVGRSLRLPVFVGVSSVLGIGAHAAVERDLPHPALAVLAVLAVSLVAALLRGRERSFEAIAVALAAGQTVVHAVLCLCHCTATSAMGVLVHTVLCPGDTGAAWAGDPWLVSPGHGTTAGTATGYLAHLYPGHTMLVVHLLAAGVAAWWLGRGEAAVWAAVGWVWPALQTPLALAPVTVTRPARFRPATAVRALRSQVDDQRAHPRRGPPVRTLVSPAPACA